MEVSRFCCMYTVSLTFDVLVAYSGRKCINPLIHTTPTQTVALSANVCRGLIEGEYLCQICGRLFEKEEENEQVMHFSQF